jgi:phosphoribosylaminoimidazole-succinocarboxamide synthase
MFESQERGLPLYRRGKVRDVYKPSGEHLLIVACDRISAFDHVLPTPIPGKGRVLTQI